MAYSVQKSRLAKVAGVSLVMLLAACSWRPHRLLSFMLQLG